MLDVGDGEDEEGAVAGNEDDSGDEEVFTSIFLTKIPLATRVFDDIPRFPIFAHQRHVVFPSAC